MSSVLLRDIEEGVLHLTLNRAEAHNALNDNLISELVNAIKDAEINRDVKVVVLRAKGKSFCAGGDVKDMRSHKGMFAGDSLDLFHQYREGIQQIPRAIESFSKPIIALIDGAAIGAGLDLACMCDIRIATPNASFAESFSRLGIISGDGGAFFLQRVVGYSKAMEMSLTGRRYTAQEAKEMKLVNIITKDLEEALDDFIQNINKQSLDALRMSKHLLKQAYREDFNQCLNQAAGFQGILQRSSDHLNSLRK